MAWQVNRAFQFAISRRPSKKTRGQTCHMRTQPFDPRVRDSLSPPKLALVQSHRKGRRDPRRFRLLSNLCRTLFLAMHVGQLCHAQFQHSSYNGSPHGKIAPVSSTSVPRAAPATIHKKNANNPVLNMDSNLVCIAITLRSIGQPNTHTIKQSRNELGKSERAHLCSTDVSPAGSARDQVNDALSAIRPLAQGWGRAHAYLPNSFPPMAKVSVSLYEKAACKRIPGD